MTNPTSSPHCIEADKVAPQAWRNGGGQTRELLAWPEAQNWQLRISRADIEKDGPFSAFPGVQRWFAVLSGAGVVLHMPAGNLQLHAGQAPLAFDGGLAPGCSLANGATQDLNLMSRGGQSHMEQVQADLPWQTQHTMCGLYTAQAGVWRCGNDQQSLGAHTLLWLPAAPATAQSFSTDPGQPPLAYWLAFTPETSA